MYFNFKIPQRFRSFGSEKFVRSIGFLFLIIGIGFSLYATKIYFDGLKAQSWIAHSGIIQSADLKTHINDDGRKSYSVNVNYQYQWEQKTYYGNRYQLHDNSGSDLERNQKILNRLNAARKNVESYTIYINPKKPNQSAIKNSVNLETQLVSIILGIVFSVFGYLMRFKASIFSRKMN